MATGVETVENSVSASPPPERLESLNEPTVIRLRNRSPLPRPIAKPVSKRPAIGSPVVIPDRRIIWILRALCLVALCASGYLAWVAFNKSKVYGCSGGDLFDCDHVLNSKWAKVFGCPVSVPAIGIYAATLLTLCVGIVAAPGSLSWARRSRITWGIITVAALSAGLAALWFIGLQTLAIGHLCQYCLVAHSCGLCIAIVILWKRPLGLRSTAKLSILSLAAVATLIGAQLMADEPVTYQIETFPTPDASAPVEAPVDNGHVVPGDPGQDADVFAPPGAGEDDVFAPPGDDDDVFAPPVMEDDVFAPPGIEGADDVFAPPATDEDSDTDGLFEPPVTDDDQAVVIPQSPPTKREIFTRREIFGSPSVEYRSSAHDVVTYVCQIVNSQTATPQQTNGQQSTPQGKTGTPSGTKTGDTTKANKPKPAPVKKERRIVSVSGGRTRLDVLHWPLLGKPTAKYIFVEMFDYTCPHCRATHKAVHETMQHYGDDLAVISLPVPLNSACNTTVRHNHPTHMNACELARIAVAAWRVSPSKFTQFHCWLFESHTARTPHEARTYAANLVGAEKLNIELNKPYASQYIAKHVELYKRAGPGAVPKLMFPRSTIVGQVTSSSILTGMIEKELVRR